MSYYAVGDAEALVACPYDKTHMIRNKRMQYHLIDCRKSHMNQDVKVCPYNAKHVLPAAEHQFHLVHCPDRTIIDRDIIYASEEQHDCIPNRPRGRIDVPPYNQVVSDSVTEDWDTEACAEPFNLMNAISFPRPKSEPGLTAPRLPPPVTRQPREEPEVLGNDAEAQSSKDEASSLFESRACNVSLSSLSISSSFSRAPAPANGGRATANAVYGHSPSRAPGGVMQQPPAFGRGRAVYLSVMASGGSPPRVGLSSVAASASTHDSSAGSSQASTKATSHGNGLKLAQTLNTTVQYQTATVTPAFPLPNKSMHN